jgi:hypothetical protein
MFVGDMALMNIRGYVHPFHVTNAYIGEQAMALGPDIFVD